MMKDLDSVPSNVQSSRQDALLYVFEDNEAVIKMIIKGRSPTMRHVSRTHRVALDWLFDRVNLDPKIQIKHIDTKNQLADILTKGNFTREEWNHLLNLFNISHFSSAVCSAAIAKRFQQDSGEERVTAKSKPLMNLIARTPSVVSSSTSLSLVKRYYGKQDPWKSVVADDGSGQPDNINSQEVARRQNFIMGSDTTELELSVESRSFVNRVNDKVRKRQKRISNVAEGEEHSIIWGMFMAVTMNSATFMGKNFQDNQNSIVNTTDLTLKLSF